MDVKSLLEGYGNFVSFLKAVHKRYPDAEETRFGGEKIIRSEKAMSDVTDVALFEVPRDGGHEMMFLPYLVLEGGRVYGAPRFFSGAYAGLALAALKKHHPDAYGALVTIVRERKSG